MKTINRVIDLLETKIVKHKAIKHWKKNIKQLRSLNWDFWQQQSSLQKQKLMLCDGSYPNIYSMDCPFGIFGRPSRRWYCNYYKRENVTKCSKCPLHVDGYNCCLIWSKIRDVYVSSESYTKEEAIKAFEEMLNYIKEKGK